MANTIITSTVVAREALALLVAKAVLPNLVRRDMDANFTAGRGDTVNVRKRSSLKAPAFTGTIVKQDLSESSVPVKLNMIRSVDIPVTAKEKTLDIADFSAQVLEPAMAALCENVDQDIYAAIVQAALGRSGDAGKVTESSTPAMKDIGALSKALDTAKVSTSDRRLILCPTHKYDYITNENLIKAAYAGDNKALREADLGRLMGMATFMDANAVAGKVGTSGTATSFKVAGTAGASKVALSSLSAATATVKTGEGFIWDGVFYRFTEDGTGVSSAIDEIDIDQPLHKTIAATDTITIIKKDYSIAFQKDAVVLAVRPLDLPSTGDGYVANADGLSVRVVYGYDQEKKQDVFSIDILYGVKVLEAKGVVALEQYVG